MATVVRSLSADFVTGPGMDIGTFNEELQAVSFASAVYQDTTAIGDVVNIEFDVLPNASDIALLDAAILSHQNVPKTDITGDQDRVLQNAITVTAPSIVETSLTTSQILLELDVTGLVGLHRISYDAGIIQGQGGIGLAEIGLQKVGGAIVSGLFSWRRSSTSEIQNANDSINVTLDGSAQSYAIIYRTSHPSTTMSVIGARIQIWRVS